MQLKKVVLHGFKSFADKTEFEFGDGIAVIVGPNGCGKSNVVDAIKWVLGEQSAKSLRGDHMLDVIFNGSNTRKSMGMAEVTLHFVNAASRLNVDTDDISVTRRLYRSGDSEYLLNDKPCRLRDIRELFMDTGIGADAYSIIEQGKVESLLQASKQDRRAIFEEAAGISKYKSRKKEALRKLERTEQNVLRLTDIIAEVEKRLRSIKYQAGKARNYQQYTARLKELRLGQFLSEYQTLLNDKSEQQATLEQTQDALTTVSAAAQQAQNRLSLLDEQIDGIERRIREHENQLLQITAGIGNQQDRIDLGHRRYDELQETLATAQRRIGDLRRQIRQLQEDLHAAEVQFDDGQTILDRQEEELRELQAQRQQHGLELAEYRHQLDDEKTGMMDIVRRTAQLHNEIGRLDDRRSGLTSQRQRLSDRSSQIDNELESMLGDRSELDYRYEQAGTLLSESRSHLEDKRQDLATISQERLECSEQLSAEKQRRSALASRRELLDEMERNFEGIDQGVRQILQDRDRARQAVSEHAANAHETADSADQEQAYYYVRGMVADCLRADVDHAQLVETALGARSQYLLADSAAAVLEDNGKLDALPGRVRMICLDQLPAADSGSPIDCDTHPAIRARMSDLVQSPDDAYRPLAQSLLGHTYLVDDLASAMELRQQHGGTWRWVTLAGQIVEPDGTIHIGPSAGAAGLISRKSELRQLQDALTQCEHSINALEQQMTHYGAQEAHLEKNLQEMRTVIYEASTEQVELRGRLEQCDQNIQRLQQEQPLISSELNGLEDQIQQTVTLQATGQKDLEDLETINRQRQGQVEVLTEQIAQLDSEDRVMAEQITELKVAAGQTRQKRLAAGERINALKSQIPAGPAQYRLAAARFVWCRG